jgi:hypothetical protein
MAISQALAGSPEAAHKKGTATIPVTMILEHRIGQ